MGVNITGGYCNIPLLFYDIYVKILPMRTETVQKT